MNTTAHDPTNSPSGARFRGAGRHRKAPHLGMRVRHFLRAAATGPVAVAGVAFPVTAAFAANGSLADQQISADLDTRVQDKRLGSNVSGVVLDAESGRQVWGHNASTALAPASNTKLATATAALTVLGPDHTFTTRVVYGHGTLTLIGGGDRVLTTADLTSLAKTAAAALAVDGITSVKVKVDDSLFPEPTPATGWKPDYYPNEVAPVRALVVDGQNDMDTSLHAGTVFATQLAAQGVRTTGTVTRGAAAATEKQVAGHNSLPLSSIVEKMLLNSDNNIAETLLRQTAIGAGQPATFEGGTAAVRQVISQRYGVAMDSVELHDGSGLSVADRIPATVLAGLLDRVTDPRYSPTLGPILRGLPVAGETGTLGPDYGRFDTAPSDCAKDKVRAKTGTLTGASALSGLTQGADGRWKVFSFVENGASAGPADTKHALDGLAATVNGCW